MADLAAELGVTEAALYRYAVGKDALVHAAFHACLFPARKPNRVTPLADPGRAATVALVARFLRNESPLPELRRRLRARNAPGQAEQELEDFVRLLFRSLAANRQALRLIERVALEWPELEHVWFGGARADFFADLTTFLARRARQGVLRTVDVTTAGSILVETAFHFAVVRHYEARPAPVDPAQLEDAVVTMLVRGLAAG